MLTHHPYTLKGKPSRVNKGTKTLSRFDVKIHLSRTGSNPLFFVKIGNENNIVFYTDEEDNIKVEVMLQNENIWLNIESLTKLFKIDRTGITRHINNIYKDEELDENSTCAKIAQVQKEGNRSLKGGKVNAQYFGELF